MSSHYLWRCLGRWVRPFKLIIVDGRAPAHMAIATTCVIFRYLIYSSFWLLPFDFFLWSLSDSRSCMTTYLSLCLFCGLLVTFYLWVLKFEPSYKVVVFLTYSCPRLSFIHHKKIMLCWLFETKISGQIMTISILSDCWDKVIWTGLFSNSTGSSVTSCWFSLFIVVHDFLYYFDFFN